MKAAVVREPGGPEKLLIEERPVPQLQPGRVLVRIRAFGLNRSELMTRNGESGAAVTFPRVLGIECAGEIVETHSPALAGGQTFLAAMGGMGRDFDGGYEEYALLPASHVIPVRTTLSWAQLGAIPETFGTAWGSLEKLRLERGHTLLVRGGTSSVGMAAITLAKDRGVRVIATTRQETKRAALEANGADHVIVDDGTIAARVKTIVPGGADALLELIGSKTTLDSLAALRPGAHACLTGFLARDWDTAAAFARAKQSTIDLQRFGSDVINRDDYGSIFQAIVDGAQDGRFHLNVDRTFALDEIADAHRYMEANLATGKVVGLT